MRRRRRQARDVLRDPEVLELLRDEPELLAIADAVHARLGGQRRRRRRRAQVTLVAVGVLVAVALLVSFLPPWNNSPSLVEQANAAISGRGPVLHTLMQTVVPGRQLVDISTGRSRPDVVELEFWFDEQRGLLHTLIRNRGYVVSDILATPGGTLSAAGQVLSAADGASNTRTLLGFASGYRRALASGRAAEYRGIPPEGRSARWLRIDTRFGHELVGLDPRNGQARELRGSSGQSRPLARVLEVEAVTRAAANLRVPREAAFGPTGGAVVARREVSIRSAARLLKRSPLWAGRRVDGLRLRVVQGQKLVRFFPHGAGHVSARRTGLALVYGAARHQLPNWERAFVQIQQATSPEPAYGFLTGPLALSAAAPAGAMILERSPMPGSPSGSSWTARLHSDGLYLTLTAPRRSLVIDAARMLRPLHIDR